MTIPTDYVERVYAGVLGKLIGVYLGRPFEGWSYDLIMEQLGEINYYVHEKLGVPLIVTDDDISGTFSFLRALPDYGHNPDITPAQIGQTWLNYLIEERTVLWWGGLGNSTEHTAYLRLKKGIQAPASGSIALNSKVVAEQIGAQIFIDGWAMVAPGDPELAANLARRAASVSHDGEAIYGAQVLAAMEAQAFVESDIDKLIDVGLSVIPNHSIIYQMINEIRGWHAAEPDWRAAREKLAGSYGYDKYGGNCHMVPNHGLIIHSLLYGDDDFQKSLMIVNTSGWDTDCNSGNLGCLLGIKNGLAGIDTGPDWRGPVADRAYLPTADGGRAINDAVTLTYEVVNTARGMAGEAPLAPKNGARFHFELPGSVQGFQLEDSVIAKGTARLENVAGNSQKGERSLAIHCHRLAPGRAARIATPTFIPSKEVVDYFEKRGYTLFASPTLYNGQTIRAGLTADAGNGQPLTTALYVDTYGRSDEIVTSRGPEIELVPGAYHEFSWPLDLSEIGPIVTVGVEISSGRAANGSVYLDYLTWEGAPDIVLQRPDYHGTMWRRAWINGIDEYNPRFHEAFRLMQNEGCGLLMQGTREWTDYKVESVITPHMVKSSGIGARVQGMRRYYGLMLAPEGKAQLVKALDGVTVLAEKDIGWRLRSSYDLRLQVTGTRLQGWVDGRQLFDLHDEDRPLEGGAVALICEEGRMAAEQVTVKPAG
ncbi:MAG: ADP-ribosylglycohydrolase family protein [Chloroflexi bacterium]|nr:ADP-ribosylglycohydrolase family protein [Chloroflexota bacterium]